MNCNLTMPCINRQVITEKFHLEINRQLCVIIVKQVKIYNCTYDTTAHIKLMDLYTMAKLTYKETLRKTTIWKIKITQHALKERITLNSM